MLCKVNVPLESNCQLLFSEDMQDGLKIETLQYAIFLQANF
jgi:predicted nucleic acid-binding protein